MNVEELFFEGESLVFQLPRLEIDDKFGIEGLIAVTHFEMQMRYPARPVKPQNPITPTNLT